MSKTNPHMTIKDEHRMMAAAFIIRTVGGLAESEKDIRALMMHIREGGDYTDWCKGRNLGASEARRVWAAHEIIRGRECVA